MPVDLSIRSDGMTAILLSGRRIDQSWRQLQRIESYNVTFTDSSQVRLSHDQRLAALRAVLSREYLPRTDRPASRLFRIIAIASVVMLPVGLTPLVTLYHTGYLLEADFLRIALAFVGMLVFLPVVVGVAAARESYSLRRQ